MSLSLQYHFICHYILYVLSNLTNFANSKINVILIGNNRGI